MWTKEKIPVWRDTSRQFVNDRYQLELNDLGNMVTVVRDGITVLIPVVNVEFMVLDLPAPVKVSMPVAIDAPAKAVPEPKQEPAPVRKRKRVNDQVL